MTGKRITKQRSGRNLFGKAGTRRRKQRAVAAQVPSEILEERKLLTGVVATPEIGDVAAAEQQQDARFEFTVRLTDLAGNTISHVQRGDEFLIEVWGHDRTESQLGVYSAYADVAFDTELIDVQETIQHHTATRHFGQVNDDGGIADEVGGFTEEAPGVAAVDLHLFTLRAVAVGDGIATVSTNAPEGILREVVAFGAEEDDLRGEAVYGSATVAIGEPTITLDKVPSIGESGIDPTFTVTIKYPGVDITELDNGGDVLVRRVSDGRELQSTVTSTVMVSEGTHRVTMTLTEPADGWNEDLNGTWEIIDEELPPFERVHGQTLGSFEIDFVSDTQIETLVRFEDVDGNEITQVKPGQQFHIVVSGQDLRGLNQDVLLGLISAFYDVRYDTDLIDVVDTIHNYGVWTAGDVIDADGLADGVGGFFSDSNAPGTADRVDVVTLVAIARRTGSLTVAATPDDGRQSEFTVFVDRGAEDVRGSVGSGQATLQIAAPLELTVTHSSISEHDGQTTLTVNRGAFDLDQPLPVFFTIRNGGSVDQTELDVVHSVVIEAGQETTTFTIDALDDNLLDGTQDLVITGTAAGYVDGDVAVAVTDHEFLTVVVNPDQVREDDGAFSITISRSDVDDLSETLDVFLSVTGGSGIALDDSQIVIPAGSASVTISGYILDNNIEDGDRVVTFTASESRFVSGSDDLTIIDVEHADVIVIGFDVLNDRVDGGATVRLQLANYGTTTARDFYVDIVHSDDNVIGSDDDDLREHYFIESLKAGSSRIVEIDIDFDVNTLVQRFKAENRLNGLPGDVVMSQMVDYVGAVVDPDGRLTESNVAGGDLAETNNSNQGLRIDMDDVTALPFDFLGDDAVVTPRDSLYVINRIGVDLNDVAAAADTNNDGRISPLDAATVLGHIGLSLNIDVMESEGIVPPVTPGGPETVGPVTGNNDGADSRVTDVLTGNASSTGSAGSSSGGASSRVTDTLSGGTSSTGAASNSSGGASSRVADTLSGGTSSTETSSSSGGGASSHVADVLSGGTSSTETTSSSGGGASSHVADVLSGGTSSTGATSSSGGGASSRAADVLSGGVVRSSSTGNGTTNNVSRTTSSPSSANRILRGTTPAPQVSATAVDQTADSSLDPSLDTIDTVFSQDLVVSDLN